MFENGFVLLASDHFNFANLISDLQDDWQLNPEDAGKVQDSFTFSLGGFLCAIAVMPTAIPNGEAAQRARINYYCPDAVEIAQAHRAHLMVTVMDQAGGPAIEVMKIYSKIIASCLKQEQAIGVYTSGTVFSADFYRLTCQESLPNGDIPVIVWVFVGLGQNEQGNQLYTVGMEKFQKKEMEILNSHLDMRTLHTSLVSMCSYIITSGLELQDGETIGFSEEQKWQITLSESVYAPSEYSLKISIS